MFDLTTNSRKSYQIMSVSLHYKKASLYFAIKDGDITIYDKRYRISRPSFVYTYIFFLLSGAEFDQQNQTKR